ncbi:MAG: hypothetical protein UHP11_04615 [Anaerovoracaceae bacterium]|nr:hypothetical protein [Anaerovoracaceae bacterium]
MNNIITILESERNQMKKLIMSSEKSLSGYEHGTLTNNGPFYYKQIRKNGKTHRSYLGKWDSEAVQKFKTSEMTRCRLKVLRQNIQLINDFLEKYLDYDWMSLNAYLPPKLAGVKLVYPFDQQYSDLISWASEKYEKNQTPFSDTIILANDGTRVRSKGECLWYNALLDSGIPFRYEPVITVIDEFGKETSQSPDFLIKCPDDSYIAIEHLGMLAYGRYAYRFSVKLQNYIRSGFVPGENLILTSDDMNGGFDCRVIERSIAYIRNRISGIR